MASNEHKFSLILGKCILEQEKKPETIRESAKTIMITMNNRSVNVGTVWKITDGRYVSTSTFQNEPLYTETFGSAKWWLELIALTDGKETKKERIAA